MAVLVEKKISTYYSQQQQRRSQVRHSDQKLLCPPKYQLQLTSSFSFTIGFLDVFCCRSFFSCFYHRNSIGVFLLLAFFKLFLVPKSQVQVQSTSEFFLHPNFSNFSHDSTGKQKRLTLTEKHDIALRLDNMLTFTDLILHTRIAKINVLRTECATLVF